MTMNSYLNSIIVIMIIYSMFLLFFYIVTRRSWIIFNYRHYLRDPKFKGLFKDKNLREKRKKQGKIFLYIFLYIFWIALILFSVLLLFSIPFKEIFLILFHTFVFIIIASFLGSYFFYVRAIHDEVLEEVISSRKTKKNKSSG